MKKQMLSILEGNKTNLSSREVVARDLPHPLLLGQEEKQPCFTRDVEDPRQRPSGMTGPFYHGTKAFTLIELLVVVLIIGILAAVALPQYQKAVEKSKAAQALTALQSLRQAQEAHKMSSGSYAASFEELDIEFPWTGNETWVDDGMITNTLSNGEWSMQIREISTDSCLWVGHLTGKYQGAGFGYCFRNSGDPLVGKLLCIERKSNGLAFAGAEGSFCRGIFKGTLLSDEGSARFYKLP